MTAFFIAFFVMHCSWQICDCCSIDDTRHSIFFMSIDSFSGYIKPDTSLCICDDASCPSNCSSNCQYDFDRIYWIHSNKDVYGLIGNDTFGEMFNALRDDYLGKEYVASVYLDVSGQSFLGVGNPTSSAITIDITLPHVNTHSLVKCENEFIRLNLLPLEARTLKFNCDITGAHIKASDNIIVYEATFSLNAPNPASSLQFMIEQLIPIEQWGLSYAVVPYGENAYGDVISIVASEPDTFVHIMGYDYSIIPEKYESIRRRIDGKRPITVTSFKPVGVTQFSINLNDKNVMSICIPITKDTNSDALTIGRSFLHNYLRYADNESVTEDNLPLSRLVANRKDSSPNTGLCCCSVYFEDAAHLGGTFCGFLQNAANSNDRNWPRMDPGDGKDNDFDGSIDEDECYSNFGPNTNPQDCSKEDIAVLTKEYFIIPVALSNQVTAIYCWSPSSSLTTISYWSANSDTWLTAPADANNVFLFVLSNSNNPLIIQSTSSSKLHLMCNYACLISHDDCSNAFYVHPINMLGSKYIANIPPCPDGSSSCESTCSISQVFNNTAFGFVKTLDSNYKRLLNNKIYTDSIKDGNFIESEYPIAVLCHSRTLSEDSYLVQFLLPLDIAGFSYNLFKTEYLVDEKLYIWSTDSYTFVNLVEFDVLTSTNVSQHMLIQNAGDNIMVDLSLDNTNTLYSISTSKPVYVIAHIKKNATFSWVTSLPFNRYNYSIVRVPSSFNVVFSTYGTETHRNFSGVTYHHISNYGWPHQSHFIKEEREKPVLSRFQIPGDGVDNDKDGLVDEEYCGFLLEDNPVEWNTLHDIDLDGSYNEDCRGCEGGQRLEPMLVCTLCDVGSFRETQSKIDKCISCGEHLTTFEFGSVSHDQCVPNCMEGMQLNNHTMSCEPCPIGFYKNVSANDSMFDVHERFWCLSCPGGLTTYNVGTVHNYECIVHCEAGEELLDTGGCQACEVGFYKDVSSTDVTASVSERWNCRPCSTSKTTFFNGTVSETECIALCIEGMELNNESMVCEPCELGYYKQASANDSSLSVDERFWCIQCPDNLTTRDVGTTDFAGCVEDCLFGEELNIDAGHCQPCSVGFYKDIASTDLTHSVEKRWHCTPCPADKTTTDVGTVDNMDCRDHCEEGMFLNGTQCQECPVGFFKDTSSVNHSLSYDLRWNCSACESGLTTYGVGSVQCIDHCGIGLQLENGTCAPCDIGFYKNTSSKDIWLTETQRWHCSQCPTGLTTNSTGADTCLPLCPMGMEYLYSSGKCELCKIGFYKNTIGSHIDCYQCPVNFTTRYKGAVGFQDCKLENCKCPCDRVNEEQNYTSEELSKLIEEMKKQLILNKAYLSATLRKKISVMDFRPSAQSIGFVGAIILVLVFGLLLGFDIVILKQHINMFFTNLRSLFI